MVLKSWLVYVTAAGRDAANVAHRAAAATHKALEDADVTIHQPEWRMAKDIFLKAGGDLAKAHDDKAQLDSIVAKLSHELSEETKRSEDLKAERRKDQGKKSTKAKNTKKMEGRERALQLSVSRLTEQVEYTQIAIEQAQI